MVDQDNKSREVKNTEDIVSGGEQAAHLEGGEGAKIELKEVSREEQQILAELRREVEKMRAVENLKGEAQKKDEKMDYLGEKDKVKHLLQIAREKGLVYAIQEARRTNEPFLLDVLHDTLSQEGYYKDFSK